MYNICFIANYDKTYLFDLVSKELLKVNINVFWIVVNNNLNSFLENNYKKENILYLNKSIDYCKPISEYKLHELIESDRILKNDMLKSKLFLEAIQSPIYNFLHENKISYIFGELTWGHEVLIQRMCTQNKELNCIFLNPHTTRIPNGNFAFFQDEFQSKFYDINNTVNGTEIKLEKPDYLALNDKLISNKNKLSYKLYVIYKFIFGKGYYDKNDPTLHSNKMLKLKNKIKEKKRRKHYQNITRKEYGFWKEKKFILFPLHKQPEASVDMFGRYYENQLELIKNLWRILPNEWYLVVKEHTNAIGDRDRCFYNEIIKYPNVHFIDEKCDSHKLILECEAVFTVTGTIAYEAALLQKQSFTFVPTFFNEFSTCHRITFEDLRTMTSLNDFIEKKKKLLSQKRDENAQLYLLKNSFRGIISDPVSDRRCMENENINLLANAIRALFVR